MGEQRRTVFLIETEPSKTFLQKVLDGVERVGNKVPHPAVIFFIMAGGRYLIILSAILVGYEVTYEVVNPEPIKLKRQRLL